MQWLVDGSQAGDVLWFHFSGHGEQVKDGSGDEADGKDEALVPIDARATRALIADDVINECLVENLPEGVTLYAVFDCCHSGTMMDLPFIYDEIGNRFRRDENVEEKGDGRVVMISGCLNEQKSADLGADIFKGIRKSVGALSRNLYKRLDKGYSWQGLIAEVRVAIAGGNLSQVPQLEVNSRRINPDDIAYAEAFGQSRKGEATRSNVPPPTDASQVPTHLLEVYESKGIRIKGMKKYLAFAQQKSKIFTHMFSRRYGRAKDFLKVRFGGGSRGRSSSRGNGDDDDDDNSSRKKSKKSRKSKRRQWSTKRSSRHRRRNDTYSSSYSGDYSDYSSRDYSY
jgi:hypothetical protein